MTLNSNLKQKALIRIVDDDETVRRALSLFLSMADWRVKAYASAIELLDADDPAEPGCMILDVRMPGTSGIELHEELCRRGSDIPVIFLSAHGDIEMAVEAVHRGAKTFLVKPPQPEKLLALIEEAVADLFERRRTRDYLADLQKQWQTLTAAEQQVALMIGKGLTSAAAAEALGVTERTVRTQRASVYDKLDLENAVELADFLHELDPILNAPKGEAR